MARVLNEAQPVEYVVDAASHTLLETAQRCDKKLEYRYVRGLSRRVKGIKPERGTWVHTLLEAYYKAIKAGSRKPVEAAHERHVKYQEEFWDELFEEEQEEFGLDLPEVCWGIFERYVERYREVDKRWRKILMVENYLKIPVPWLPVKLGVKCDLVVLDDSGWVWIYDHKVVGSIPEEEERTLDTQGPRYILGMQELLKAKGIKARGVGMVYDYIRDRLPGRPKLKKDGKISVAQIDSDVDTVISAIKENGEDPADYEDFIDKVARSGQPFFERWPVPRSDERLYQEKENLQAIVYDKLPRKRFYPRNLNRFQCKWDCEYKDLCLVELEGGDITDMVRRDYAVRREEDEDARS